MPTPIILRGGLPLRPGLKVGLLGGSFNPAHEGHFHISLLALERLGLDEIWWLVSPQNPLKSPIGMAPLDQRLRGARGLAVDSRIRVLDLEEKLGTQYTVETTTCIKSLFPQTMFVWLMGADNLAQMPRWRRWTTLFATLPIAILGRPTYSLGALAGVAARRYRRYRVRPGEIRGLTGRRPPAWAFIPGPLHQGSATAIRKTQKNTTTKNTTTETSRGVPSHSNP